jgi:hypothetical protein
MRVDYYDEPYCVPCLFRGTPTARRYLEHIQYRSRRNVEKEDGLDLSSRVASDEVTFLRRKRKE